MQPDAGTGGLPGGLIGRAACTQQAGQQGGNGSCQHIPRACRGQDRMTAGVDRQTTIRCRHHSAGAFQHRHGIETRRQRAGADRPVCLDIGHRHPQKARGLQRMRREDAAGGRRRLGQQTQRVGIDHQRRLAGQCMVQPLLRRLVLPQTAAHHQDGGRPRQGDISAPHEAHDFRVKRIDRLPCLAGCVLRDVHLVVGLVRQRCG